MHSKGAGGRNSLPAQTLEAGTAYQRKKGPERDIRREQGQLGP